MNMIKFEVPGEPRGKGRPRASRMGANIRLYTDAKTAAYENLVALACKQAMRETNQPALTGAVSLSVYAYAGIPKSASKALRTRMLKGEVRPTKRPDLDNIIKAVLDGLNEVAFADDSQVVFIAGDKLYSVEPRLTVIVGALDDQTHAVVVP